MSKLWYLYLLDCTGGGVYVGIAKDVDARYAEHLAGRGALYTRLHRPLRILAVKTYPDHRSAAQDERQVKRLSPLEKRRYAWALSGEDESAEHAGSIGVAGVEQQAESL